MKRFLQDTCAAPYIQKKTKDAASGSSAALQDTCWKYFRGVERQASDSYWYLATFNFCAHAERLGDIAAESGRIPKGAFVRWAMQLLSVTVQRCSGEMLRCTAGVGWSSRGSKVCVTVLALQCQC